MGQRRSRKSLKKLIFDASVLLKLVLPAQDEADTKQVVSLFKLFTRNKLVISLPIFWSFEVGNTLIRKLPYQEFEEKFFYLLKQPFEIYNFNPQENIEIGYLAMDNQVSFYDASYHYLAKLTDSILLTADFKYFQKNRSDSSLLLISDLKL